MMEYFVNNYLVNYSLTTQLSEQCMARQVTEQHDMARAGNKQCDMERQGTEQQDKAR